MVLTRYVSTECFVFVGDFFPSIARENVFVQKSEIDRHISFVNTEHVLVGKKGCLSLTLSIDASSVRNKTFDGDEGGFNCGHFVSYS